MNEPKIIGEKYGMPVWDVTGLEPFKMDDDGAPIYKIKENVFTFSDGSQMSILDMCGHGVMTEDHLESIWNKING